MDNRYHKGYRVTIRSFRSGVRWRTEVVIATMKRPPAELVLPLPPTSWSASSEQEADEYGFAMAKDWIARTEE
jgi:hypothetical protein